MSSYDYPPPPPDPWDEGGRAPQSGAYGPPAWPPTYWVEAPPPPPSRWRVAGAVLGILLIFAGVAAGVAIAVHRLAGPSPLTGTTVSNVDAAVVDVNTDLGGGNTAAGTGMVISSTGDILTNNHVVAGALRVSVEMVSSGQTIDAAVVGVDPTDDVAVLHIANTSHLPTAPLGDSSRLNVGDAVTAIGNALGRGGPPAVTTGQVTALGQTVTATDADGSNAETLNGMIQFNAQIQPGDSGGPLLNSSGQVVGMDTAGGGRVRRPDLGSSVGFAIPINTAISIAHQILSGSTSPNITTGRRPLLGVEAQDSASPPGALVISVQPGTPADGAGIQAQDVIVAIDGTTIDSVTALHNALSRHRPGDQVTVSWLDSSGATHSARVQLIAGGVP